MAREAAIRGEGSTALSMAVRLGAPFQIIEQLVFADIHQIGVTHVVRGTVLHEAFKHRTNDDTLDFLIKAVIDYDSKLIPCKKRTPNMLSYKDELGRTALHYMVDRIVRSLDRGEKIQTLWSLFRFMVQACPMSVQTVDADGNTPLILLLLIPKVTAASGDVEIENELQLMLELCPRAVQVTRRLPRPWHYQFKTESQTSLVHGDGVPSPLSCALLHERSMKTVDLLLDANRSLGVSGCRTVVTHHREIPLHIAVTMRCPTKLLCTLVHGESSVVGVTDIYGLNSLDWVWIRHVLDWCSLADPFAPVVVSRRRYLNNHFMEWYNKVSNQYLGIDNPLVSELARRLRQDVLSRMSILLPSMSEKYFVDEMVDDESNVLPLLHSACCINCPLAMVQIACESSPQDLRSRDKKLKRLPLHYAVGRKGYAAQFPIGVSCNLQYAEEISPVNTILSKFPNACRITDKHQQLPLHIAIQYAKKQLPSQNEVMKIGGKIAESYEEIEALLKGYPEGLHQRDGVTKLFPFMQAAGGADSNLDLTFLLLRRDPSLLTI
jgi:hypothetical protein